MSIFEKLCPSCASRVAASAETCDCGHIFESADGSGKSTPETALRDEELYENYLAARADQANEAARAAHEAYHARPEDPNLAAAAELAREVATSIATDLADQRSKVAALRKMLPPAPKPMVAAPKPAAPKIEPRKIAASPHKPVSATPKPPTSAKAMPAEIAKPAPVAQVATPAPIAADSSAQPEPQPAAQSAAPATRSDILFETQPVRLSAPASPAPLAPPPLSTAERAASVLETIKKAKAREEATRAIQNVERANEAIAHVPPESFRTEQAARAEKALAVQKALDVKECGNCTAKVPVNTTRCRCGYVFDLGTNDLPSLTLCTGDFTALRDSLNLNLRRNS